MRETFVQEAARFNALSSPHRLLLLTIIAESRGTKNVQGLEAEMSARGCTLKQPTISLHLKILRDAGLVSRELKGLEKFYYIVPGPFAEMASMLATIAQQAESVEHEEVAAC